MTEQEIITQANEYAEQHKMRTDYGYGWQETYDTKQQAEAYIAGAHSRDEEITRLSAEIEDDNYVISKLHNPWISVEEILPEIEDEKEERTGEVFVCIKDGVYLVAHYSYFYKAWYAFDDRGGCMYRKIRTPRYWMSIPELKKGE